MAAMRMKFYISGARMMRGYQLDAPIRGKLGKDLVGQVKSAVGQSHPLGGRFQEARFDESLKGTMVHVKKACAEPLIKATRRDALEKPEAEDHRIIHLFALRHRLVDSTGGRRHRAFRRTGRGQPDVGVAALLPVTVGAGAESEPTAAAPVDLVVRAPLPREGKV